MSVNFTATGAMLNGVRIAGWSTLGCQQFDPHDPRRQVWDGKWPGEADCAGLGFFVNDDPAFPDLNRLFTECVWDADTGRWERKQ